MKRLKSFIIRWLLMVATVAICLFQTVAAEENISAGSVKNPSAVIYSVSVYPAKVAAGDTVQMETVFSVFDDSSRSSLPLKYFYEIEKQGEIVFRSPDKTMDVDNGAKTSLAIKFEAAGGKGDYKMALNLIRPEWKPGWDVGIEETHPLRSILSLNQACLI